MADRGETRLVALGRSWVIEHYPYNRTHLLKTLDWLDRLQPEAPEAVRLAALTHDMERAFGGPDAIPIVMNSREYRGGALEPEREDRRRVASRTEGR